MRVILNAQNGFQWLQTDAFGLSDAFSAGKSTSPPSHLNAGLPLTLSGRLLSAGV